MGQNWMMNLLDTLLVSEVNIPGSHDCAAISKSRGKWHRHDCSIYDQLNKGIRLLDVRIAIMKEDVNGLEKSAEGFLSQHGDRAVGFFVEYPTNCYIPLQLPTTETFGDLKHTLQQLTNVPVEQQLIEDTGGSPLADTVTITDWWPDASNQAIIKLTPAYASHETSTPPPPPSWSYQWKYEFLTTHGKGHHYQSFISLMDECKTFLTHQPTECLIINFQVDDGDKSDPMALHLLKGIVNSDRYPLLLRGDTSGTLSTSPEPPLMGELRGKMFLMNRINEDYLLGVPLPMWVEQQNCEFIVGNNEGRDGFRVFVQDKFTGFDKETVEKSKAELVLETLRLFKQAVGKTDEDISGSTAAVRCRDILMNYASVSSGKEVFNTKTRLLKHFTLSHSVPRGWMLFDYPFDTEVSSIQSLYPVGGKEGSSGITIVDVIIASNFVGTDGRTSAF
jgi:hypothetical protein